MMSKVFAVLCRLQQDRAGAIAEDDAGGAIGKVGHG